MINDKVVVRLQCRNCDWSATEVSKYTAKDAAADHINHHYSEDTDTYYPYQDHVVDATEITVFQHEW